MRAELVLLGRPVSLSLQTQRRRLVIAIYLGLALVMAALGVLDNWRGSGYYLVALALIVNHFLLGGYGRQGLVRPFDGQAPRPPAVPSPLIPLGLYLRLTPTAPAGDYLSDERELALRDRAHYQAYQWLSAVIGALWLFSGWATAKSTAFPILHTIAADILYPTALITVILMLTLPQAILLWTEPDMPNFDPAE